MSKFSKKHRKILKKIFLSRRDIRGNHFTSKKLSTKKLNKILKSSLNAPSVGYSQPWRFKIVDDKQRNKIHKNFQKSFLKSQKKFKNKPLYKNLKLEGINESSHNIAVFYKKSKKDILGQTYMKRSGEYSVVCAIYNMWLMARTMDIGIGWVSIIKPKKVRKILGVNKNYKLVAYLCIGYTDLFLDEPELKSLKWEKRKKLKNCILK